MPVDALLKGYVPIERVLFYPGASPSLSAPERGWKKQDRCRLACCVVQSLGEVGGEVGGGLQTYVQADDGVVVVMPIAVGLQGGVVDELDQAFETTPGEADTDKGKPVEETEGGS